MESRPGHRRSPLERSLIVWLGMMALETVHGILRNLLLAPRLGDFRARQVSIVPAVLMIWIVTGLTARWVGAGSARLRLGLGLLWVGLTLGFELAIGRLAGLPWRRLLEDYDLAHGGLMPFGLLAMGLAPWLAGRRLDRRRSA